MNLGSLYTPFDNIDIARDAIAYLTKKDTSQIKDLNWPYINLPYQILEKAAKLIFADPDKYKYVTGCITLATELGKIHPGQLYSAFGDIKKARDVITHLIKQDASNIEDLQWLYVNIPYETMEKAAGLLLANPNKYRDIAGYITLARELGKVHLGQLYSAFGNINTAREIISYLTNKDASELKDLNWLKIGYAYDVLEKAAYLIQANPDKYKGVIGYITLAKELGRAHLGHLYSAFGNLDTAREVISCLTNKDVSKMEDLNWSNIKLPYETIEKAAELILADTDKYRGIAGSLTLAEELGRVNLGQLYSAFGDMEKVRDVVAYLTEKDASNIEDLQWVNLKLPYQTLEKAATLIQSNPDKYENITGYITLSRELGKVNLGNLYSAFSNIDTARKVIACLTRKKVSSLKDLNWPKVSLPYEMLEKIAKRIQEVGIDQYIQTDTKTFCSSYEEISSLDPYFVSNAFPKDRETLQQILDILLTEDEEILGELGVGYIDDSMEGKSFTMSVNKDLLPEESDEYRAIVRSWERLQELYPGARFGKISQNGNGKLISIYCKKTKTDGATGITSEEEIGSGAVSIQGDNFDVLKRHLIALLNIAFAASNIPDVESDEYAVDVSGVFKRINEQYKLITGKDIVDVDIDIDVNEATQEAIQAVIDALRNIHIPPIERIDPDRELGPDTREEVLQAA